MDVSEDESPQLPCTFPVIEPPGPRGDSASAVAARHVIEKSGCDCWFHQVSGDWEEVLRFWPPPEDVHLGRPPKARPDPYGIRELVWRCQRHEELVRSLLVAQHGTASGFSAAEFPCPKASEWCFWTSEGKQLVVDSAAPPPPEDAPEGGEGSSQPVVKRCPPEGARWRLLKSALRDQFSMVYKATRLRKLEKAIRKKDKVQVQTLLDALSSRAPEGLAKAARDLLAPPPPPKPPPQAAAPAMKAPPNQAMGMGGLAPGAPAPALSKVAAMTPGFGATSMVAGLAPSSQPAVDGLGLFSGTGVGTLPPAMALASPGTGLAPSLPGTLQAMPGMKAPPAAPGMQPRPSVPGGGAFGGQGPRPGGPEPPHKAPALQPDSDKPAMGARPEIMRKQPPHAGATPFVEAYAKSSVNPIDFAKGAPSFVEAYAKSSVNPIEFAKAVASSPPGAEAALAPKLPAASAAAAEAFAKVPSAPDRGSAGTVNKAAALAPTAPPEGQIPCKAPAQEPFAKLAAAEAHGKGPGAPAAAAGLPTKAAPGAVPEIYAKLASARPQLAAGQQSSGLLAPGAVGGGSAAGPMQKPWSMAGTPPPTKAPPGLAPPQWKAAYPGGAVAMPTPAVSDAVAGGFPTKAAPTAFPAGGVPAVAAAQQAPPAAFPAVGPAVGASQTVSSSAAPGPPPPTKAPPPATAQAPAAAAPPAAAPGGGSAEDAAKAAAASPAKASPGGTQEPPAEAPWKKRRRGRGGAGEAPAGERPTATTPEKAKTSEPKRGAADMAAAERIAASAERAAAAVRGEADGTSDLARRKVVVAGIPPNGRLTELADFFTGAIFSATGHTLAAQWQSGEASKVVIGVELAGGAAAPAASRVAEVTFGTALGAAVCVALNGIQFQGKALSIKRPKGYTGPQQRPKLQGVSIKDLVASDGDKRGGASAGKAAEAGARPSGSGASVRLSGIPSSMGSKSVFDLLQQFGGPLQSLNLSMNKDTGDHLGTGVAEYVERASAIEAVRFSPLLGFIEVQHLEAGEAASAGAAAESSAAKRQRRSRFDEEEEDLGPFEAALQQREQAQRGGAPEEEAVDLGPFEAVLPPRRKAERETAEEGAEDLGPFEAILPPRPAPAEDLGPFEAVLPPPKSTASEAS